VIIEEEELDQEILVDATVLQEGEILVDATEVIEDTKKKVKTHMEKLLEGKARAREWAKSLSDRKGGKY
jgi:hypothetical protein